MSLVAFGVLAAVALGAVAAPVIMPDDPDATDAEHALEAPSWRHGLGTDLYGRDQLTRIVYAGRIDLLVALAAPWANATWKCIDEKGVTHIGDTPPPGCAAEPHRKRLRIGVR